MIHELSDIEASVQDLLSLAQTEIEERRLQEHRESQIEQTTTEIIARLQPLLQQVEASLEQFRQEGYTDSLSYKKLLDKAAEIQAKITDAPTLAALTVDQHMLLNEERLLNERQGEQVNGWRRQLKDDLLDMIDEQDDFFSATDAAIAIRGYMTDLKSIDALNEVVGALMDRINSLSKEGPVAKLRGSHENTLNFIYNKALENRAKVERPYEVQPRLRHRASDKRPNAYSDLSGKVVVFGGHDRLETAVRNRLRDAAITLIWCTAQAGPQLMEQSESHIPTADLVIVITGYASHKLTEKAMRAAERSGKSVEMINTTGMIRLLEAIEYGLKAQQLAQRLRSA